MGSETQIPEISSHGIEHVCKLLNHTSPSAAEFAPLLHLVYPYTLTHSASNIRVVEEALHRFRLSSGPIPTVTTPVKSHAPSKTSKSFLKERLGGLFGADRHATGTPVDLPQLPIPTRGDADVVVTLARFQANGTPLPLNVGTFASAEGFSASSSHHHIVPTDAQTHTLRNMMLSHSSADLCLIGPRGVGKTVLVEEFARRLGYAIRPVLLHKDMSSRDLLQQRTMESNGDTAWKLSPLVLAALDG